jgi:site-specific DNA recombinase
MSEQRIFRCAVYTRKSSEEGLEQDFNSLEAQREACEAYIRSQSHEGWTLIPDRFDDGGFSGGNMQRPALGQLMAMVDDGRIDIIVVYKIDRLTRSLTDFAKLADRLDKNGVSFVSVTQQFNTTSSMGRLMLNVLLSFAQFEREITGERIRDKIAASKKKGMWMGGSPPMGYDVIDRHLVVNETDAATIRTVFALYLEMGSVPALLDRLQQDGIRTAARYSARGNHYGNRPFTRGHLYKLLANPIYIGRVPHKTTSHRGQHPAIIEKATWDAVQAQLAHNTQGPRTRRRRAAAQSHLLEGLLRSETGNMFLPGHATKGSRRYRYYVEQVTSQDDGRAQPPIRLPAAEIETAAVTAIRTILTDQIALARQLDDVPASELGGALNTAGGLAARLGKTTDQQVADQLRTLIRSIEYRRDSLTIQLAGSGLASVLGIRAAPIYTSWPSNTPTVPSDFSVTVPHRTKRRGLQTKLVLNNAEPPPSPDASLIAAVVRAWDWADRLVSGKATTMAQICAEEGLSDSYVGQLLPLGFLAPTIVEDILAGRQPATLTAQKLIWQQELALSWSGQVADLS